MTVKEDVRNITLTLLRRQGTFGPVSAFCFSQSPPDGATLGKDFIFEPRVGIHALIVFQNPKPKKYFGSMLCSRNELLSLICH